MIEIPVGTSVCYRDEDGKDLPAVVEASAADGKHSLIVTDGLSPAYRAVGVSYRVPRRSTTFSLPGEPGETE